MINKETQISFVSYPCMNYSVCFKIINKEILGFIMGHLQRCFRSLKKRPGFHKYIFANSLR
jgi:hypothetical protein